MAYYPPWEGDVQYDYSYYGNQEQSPEEAQYYTNNPPAATEYDYGDAAYAKENEYPQPYDYQNYPYEEYPQETYQQQEYEQPPATYYPNEYENAQYPGYSDPYYQDYAAQEASMLQASADPAYYQSQAEYDVNAGYYADASAPQPRAKAEGRTAQSLQKRTNSPAESGRATAKTAAARRTSEQNSTRNARPKKGESVPAAAGEATRAQKPRKPPEATPRAQTTTTTAAAAAAAAAQKAAAVAAAAATARSKASAATHTLSPSRSPPPASAPRTFKPARIPTSDAVPGSPSAPAVRRCHTSTAASPKRSVPHPATAGGIPAPYHVRTPTPDRPPAHTPSLGHAGSASEHQRSPHARLKETPKLTAQDMGRIKKVMDVSSRYMKPQKRLTPSQERLARNASGDAAADPIVVSNMKQDGTESGVQSNDVESASLIGQTAQEHRALQRLAMERPRYRSDEAGGAETRRLSYSSAGKERNTTQMDVVLRDRTKAVYEKIAKEKLMRERRHVLQEMSHKAKERKPSTVPLAAADRTLLTLKTTRGQEVPVKKVSSSDGSRPIGGAGEETGDAGSCLPRIEERPPTHFGGHAPTAAPGPPRASRSDPRFVTPK